MALLKGFDPSKQAVVKRRFHEGGRKYVEGDLYSPRSKVGKTKALFRHFVARRIEFVEDSSKPEVKKAQEEPKQQTHTPEATPDPVGDDVTQKKDEEVKEYSAPKKRGRKKKTSEDNTDLS